MLRFELHPFMPSSVRRDVINRIKKELKTARTIPVRIVVKAGARVPRIFKTNSRVHISRM